MLRRIGSGPLPEESLPVRHFEGFPYLVTHIVPALYHLIILPAELDRKDLAAITRRQVLANRLKSCLVLGETDCVYFDLAGNATEAVAIPGCTHWCAGRLLPAVEFVANDDLVRRREALGLFIASLRLNGYMLGDVTKGGRPATREELARLAGRSGVGVPTGLARCPRCGDWRGECLDSNPQFRGLVMRVACRCENDNRCARCGELLNDRKLNANYFEPADGEIWHVPGFSGLDHHCPPPVPSSRAGN